MNRFKAFGVAALFGVCLLWGSPGVADQRNLVLTDAAVLAPQEKGDALRYLAIGAGAVAGVVALNILTGGMALAPLVGAGLMDSGVVAAVAADGGLSAGVRVTTRWASVALAAIGGGIAGAALYD